MAKRRTRTIRHPSSVPIIQGTRERVNLPGGPSGEVLDEPTTVTKIPSIKLAKAKSVTPPDANWYTEADAVKVGEYLAGARELSFNELQKYDLNKDGKVTAVDGMAIRQYMEDKVERGPSGYSLFDANLVAKHLAGLITIPPNMISRFDANGDGKVDIADAMVIAQAVENPPAPVEVPDVRPPMPTKELSPNETYVWDENLQAWLVMASQGTTPAPSVAPLPVYPDFDPRPPQPIETPKEGYVWARTGWAVLDINPITGSPYMGGRRGDNEPIPEYKWLQVPARFADISDDGVLEYDNMKWSKIAREGTPSSAIKLVSSPIKNTNPWILQAGGLTRPSERGIALYRQYHPSITSPYSPDIVKWLDRRWKQQSVTDSIAVTSAGSAKVTTTKAKSKAKTKRATPKVSSVWL